MAGKTITRDGLLRGGFAVVARLLLLAAAGVSAYLLSVSLTGGGVVGCAPGSACDEVMHSRWAYVFGIPVSAPALILDLALLLATCSCAARSNPKQRRGAWEILLPGAILLIGAALWFTALQAFIIHRFCPWCLAAHTCGSVAAILLLMRVPVADEAERKEKTAFVPRSVATKLAIAAIVAVTLLGVAQIAAPKKSYAVSSISPVASNAVVQQSIPDVPMLDVLGGRIRLNLTEVPIWGSPKAPHKIVSLYDYSCHHCQIMHSRIVEVQRSFADRLAVVSLPMPMDSQCNPTVRITPPAHTNACLYARLGLAVWRAKPSVIEPFDDWFFTFEHPPSLIEATNRAVQLVGGIGVLESALRDPWIERQLATDIAIYTTSGREFRRLQMPQFILGTNVVFGIVETEELRALVGKYMNAGNGLAR